MWVALRWLSGAYPLATNTLWGGFGWLCPAFKVRSSEFIISIPNTTCLPCLPRGGLGASGPTLDPPYTRRTSQTHPFLSGKLIQRSKADCRCCRKEAQETHKGWEFVLVLLPPRLFAANPLTFKDLSLKDDGRNVPPALPCHAFRPPSERHQIVARSPLSVPCSAFSISAFPHRSCSVVTDH